MDMEFVYNFFVRRDNKVLLNSNAFKPAQSINQTPPTAKLSSQMMVNLSLSHCVVIDSFFCPLPQWTYSVQRSVSFQRN